MKKILVSIAVVLSCSLVSQAQFFSFGLKGGVNGAKLKFSGFEANVLNADKVDLSTVKVTPAETKLGFHFGAMARIKVLSVFIQPELLFSAVNSSIDIKESVSNNIDELVNVKYNVIDVPVLVGMKFAFAHVALGPVATFNVSSKTDAKKQVQELVDDYTSVSNKATFGMQIGAGIDILKKVTIDARYQFGISKLTDSVKIGDKEYNTDQRQNQFLVSVGYFF